MADQAISRRIEVMRWGAMHILLVEDISDHAELIANVITENSDDVELQRASTAEEALRLAAAEQFDLLLTDYRINDTECFEMIAELRRADIDLPIIILTGQGNEEVASEAFDSGVTDYLIKADVFRKPEQLVRSIRAAVERSRLQRALGESEELYRTLVQNLREGVFVLRGESLRFFNPSLLRILEIDRQRILDINFYELFTLDHRERLKRFVQEAMEGGEPMEGEFTMIGPESRPEVITALTVSRCLYDGAAALIGTVRDVTDRVHAERELKKLLREKERLSVTDDLTDLANRRRVMEVLEVEIARARRYGGALALVMLDIDDFKLINDTRGHMHGDKVLAIIAGILKSEMRESDIAARYGGDEFMLVLPETNLEQARVLAERVRARVAAGNADGAALSVSLGVAELDGEADNITSLIKRTDDALLAAKEQGKNAVSALNSGEEEQR